MRVLDLIDNSVNLRSTTITYAPVQDGVFACASTASFNESHVAASGSCSYDQLSGDLGTWNSGSRPADRMRRSANLEHQGLSCRYRHG